MFPLSSVSLFSCCGGHERAYSDRVQNPESLEVPFFEEEVFSLLHKLRLEQGVPKGRVPEFLASRFP